LETSGQLDKMPKKEAAAIRRSLTKLRKNLAGLRNMTALPSVVFVVDAKKEAIAIRECERLHIPCIAVVDTNADPDAVPMPVPGNDDAIRAIGLYCSVVADAAIEGQAHLEKVRAEQPARFPRARRIAAAGGSEAEGAAEAPAEEASEEAAETVAVAAGDEEVKHELEGDM
jgi:small subunit ribosomal protein S2